MIIMVTDEELRRVIDELNETCPPDDIDHVTYTTAGLLLEKLGIVVASPLFLEEEVN